MKKEESFVSIVLINGKQIETLKKKLNLVSAFRKANLKSGEKKGNFVNLVQINEK